MSFLRGIPYSLSNLIQPSCQSAFALKGRPLALPLKAETNLGL
jgi:hypothetical protein